MLPIPQIGACITLAVCYCVVGLYGWHNIGKKDQARARTSFERTQIVVASLAWAVQSFVTLQQYVDKDLFAALNALLALVVLFATLHWRFYHCLTSLAGFFMAFAATSIASAEEKISGSLGPVSVVFVFLQWLCLPVSWHVFRTQSRHRDPFIVETELQFQDGDSEESFQPIESA